MLGCIDTANVGVHGHLWCHIIIIGWYILLLQHLLLIFQVLLLEWLKFLFKIQATSLRLLRKVHMINRNRIIDLYMLIIIGICPRLQAILSDDALVVALNGVSCSWIVAVACRRTGSITIWIVNILMGSGDHSVIRFTFSWNLFLNKSFVFVFRETNAVSGFTYFPLFIWWNIRGHMTSHSLLPGIGVFRRLPSFPILPLLACYIRWALDRHGFIIILDCFEIVWGSTHILVSSHVVWCLREHFLVVAFGRWTCLLVNFACCFMHWGVSWDFHFLNEVIWIGNTDFDIAEVIVLAHCTKY